MQPTLPRQHDELDRRVLDLAVKLAVVSVILVWCFQILRPFLGPVLWGMVLAVAVFPLQERLERALGGRRKLAATLLTLGALAGILVPSALLAVNLVEGAQVVAGRLEEGGLDVPSPPAGLAEWPVVGPKLAHWWELAESDLDAVLVDMQPELEGLGLWLLERLGRVLVQVGLFALSILVAGVFLATAQAEGRFARGVARRLAGERGPDLVDLCASTIRGVANGVVGVAVIQALAGGLGLLAVGVPWAGIWALAVLLGAVVQLSPLVVLGPIAVWVFFERAPTPAVLFAVWSLLVSVSDTFLKPLLLGGRVQVPLLVILLGSLGGMLLSGIIGLFLGAVILTLGYTLFVRWAALGATEADAAGSAGDAAEPAAGPVG